MLFEVTHTTRYSYQSPVSHSLNELRLTPRGLANQEVRKNEVRVQPEPAFMHRRRDYYGNDTIGFELVEKHDYLEIKAESIVEVQAQPAEPLACIPWEDARQQTTAITDTNGIEVVEFAYSSPYIPALPELDEYARPTFSPRRPLLEALQE